MSSIQCWKIRLLKQNSVDRILLELKQNGKIQLSAITGVNEELATLKTNIKEAFGNLAQVLLRVRSRRHAKRKKSSGNVIIQFMATIVQHQPKTYKHGQS